MGELCATLTKPSRGLPPTRWVGESGVEQLGMLGFQIAQLAHQRVVFGVADLGLVQHVVQALVMAQRFAQLFDPGGDFLRHRRLSL